MKTTRKCAIGIALALGLTIHSATTLSAPRAPRIETGPDAEVSFDGLHRVQRSIMDEAWAVPDLDLTGYSKLMLGTAGISYREVDDPGRSTERRRSSRSVRNRANGFVKPSGRSGPRSSRT